MVDKKKPVGYKIDDKIMYLDEPAVIQCKSIFASTLNIKCNIVADITQYTNTS